MIINSRHEFYVYKHTLPKEVSGKPNDMVYIGITSQNPKDRWDSGKSGYRGNKYFYRAISKYGWKNFEHEILYTHLSRNEAEQKEIELIAFYKSNDRKYGYNIQNGGTHNGKHSLETKILIGMKVKGKSHPFSEYGRKKLSEERKGAGNPMYGKHLTDAQKQKISNVLKDKMKGKFLGSKSPKAKRIYQLDKFGNIIKEFGATTEAQRELGIDYASIVKVCLGKRKTAGGYCWRYVDEVV